MPTGDDPDWTTVVRAEQVDMDRQHRTGVGGLHVGPAHRRGLRVEFLIHGRHPPAELVSRALTHLRSRPHILDGRLRQNLQRLLGQHLGWMARHRRNDHDHLRRNAVAVRAKAGRADLSRDGTGLITRRFTRLSSIPPIQDPSTSRSLRSRRGSADPDRNQGSMMRSSAWPARPRV